MLQPKKPIQLKEVVINGQRPAPKPKPIDSVSFGHGLSKQKFALNDVKEAVRNNKVQADTSNNNPDITRGNTDKKEAVASAISAMRYRKASKK